MPTSTASLAGRLPAELQRLYGGPGRAAVLAFARAADWPAVAALCRGLVDDLGLPVPALAVDGRSGFQVWLSFAEALPAAPVQALLALLQRDYLASVPAAALRVALADLPPPPPAEQPGGERWSAFIDPELGGMFTAEPWLDCAPSPDQQAELLAACASVGRGDLDRVLARPGVAPAAPVAVPATPGLAGPFADPQSFLLAVINDPALPLAQRLDAAKALLPYWR